MIVSSRENNFFSEHIAVGPGFCDSFFAAAMYVASEPGELCAPLPKLTTFQSHVRTFPRVSEKTMATPISSDRRELRRVALAHLVKSAAVSVYWLGPGRIL